MSVTYRRIFHRWDILRGGIPGLAFFLLSVGVELVFYYYMVSRGLADRTFTIPIFSTTLAFSIPLLVCLASAVFLLTLWANIFENTAFVMAGPDRKVRRILYPLRMVRAAALILAPFTIILFTPYFVQSAWFISSVASFSNSVPSFKQSAVNFYTWSFGVSRMDASTKFLLSQLSAAFGAIVVSGVQLWRVKGTRNLMLLLRKRRR